MRRIIIDGNQCYEIDEECVKTKRKQWMAQDREDAENFKKEKRQNEQAKQGTRKNPQSRKR